MRKIEEIIVHCTDSPESMDIGFVEIDKWHKERGWGMDVYGQKMSCGYHYIIRRNGVVEVGRPESIMGAHCQGHNSYSIGIVLVGRDKFEPVQFDVLRRVVADLKGRYGNLSVYPHNHYDKNKTCPNFGVKGVLGL